jgi:hypothetical protein
MLKGGRLYSLASFFYHLKKFVGNIAIGCYELFSFFSLYNVVDANPKQYDKGDY